MVAALVNAKDRAKMGEFGLSVSRRYCVGITSVRAAYGGVGIG